MTSAHQGRAKEEKKPGILPEKVGLQDGGGRDQNGGLEAVRSEVGAEVPQVDGGLAGGRGQPVPVARPRPAAQVVRVEGEALDQLTTRYSSQFNKIIMEN